VSFAIIFSTDKMLTMPGNSIIDANANPIPLIRVPETNTQSLSKSGLLCSWYMRPSNVIERRDHLLITIFWGFAKLGGACHSPAEVSHFHLHGLAYALIA